MPKFRIEVLVKEMSSRVYEVDADDEEAAEASFHASDATELDEDEDRETLEMSIVRIVEVDGGGYELDVVGSETLEVRNTSTEEK